MREVGNAAIMAVAFLVGLPSVVVAERLRVGWGRRIGLAFIRTLCRVIDVRVEVRGAALPADAWRTVVVANHRSALDIPALLLSFPDVRFVAAKELLDIKLLGPAIAAFGSIGVDRSKPAAAWRELMAMADGETPWTLGVFAEGRIVHAGEHETFKPGAFALAVRGGATVLPVAIRGTRDRMPPGRRFRIAPGVITVDVLDPIPTTGLKRSDWTRLAEATQSSIEAVVQEAR